MDNERNLAFELVIKIALDYNLAFQQRKASLLSSGALSEQMVLAGYRTIAIDLGRSAGHTTWACSYVAQHEDTQLVFTSARMEEQMINMWPQIRGRATSVHKGNYRHKNALTIVDAASILDTNTRSYLFRDLTGKTDQLLLLG